MGGNLAWREVNISWFIVIGFLIVLLFSCVRNSGDTLIKKRERLFVVLVACASFFCVELSMMLVWTPTTFDYITGVQGRYFIPFLLLILMGLRNTQLNVRRNIDKELIFISGMLNILTLLQVIQRVLK